MTDETDDSVLLGDKVQIGADGEQMFSSFAAHREHEMKSAFGRLDLDRLWQICGGKDSPGGDFVNDLREALQFYRPGPNPSAFLPAKQRKPLYDKLEKAIGTLRDQLVNMDDFVAFEIDAASIQLEPDDFDQYASGEYAGLSYGEYQLFTLLQNLDEYSEIVCAARESHTKPKGKPKQNRILEETVKDLGAVFEKYASQEPMAGYRFSDWDGIDESQVYHGPFFDFLHAIFWSMHGKGNPTSNTIGDAARRAFELRK